MKTTKLLITVFFLISILSCNKKNEPSEVNIIYELTDDVSPTKVLFKPDINGEVVAITWTINDDGFYDPDEKECYIEFEEKGTYNIKFIGYSYDKGTLEGEVDIEIPDKASKLEIAGFHFSKDLNNFPLEDKEYTVFVSYSNENGYITKTINPVDLNVGDTIFFEETILFNVNPTMNNSGYIGMSIRLKENNSFIIFSASVNISSAYYVGRNDDIGNIESLYLGSPYASNDSITGLFLLADWKP